MSDDLKRALEDEIGNALMLYIDPEKMADARLRITMALSGYDVSKSERAITVYNGDANEMIMRRFLSAKIAQGCSERTIKYYRTDIARTLEKIGKPYNEVTADDIRLFLARELHISKVSKATANNSRRNLSAFYGWLQKEEILLKNPMNKISPIKDTKKKKKAFENMELEKLRCACRTKRETAIIEILISTWCRVSELCQIKMVEIEVNKVILHGKGDKERTAYLNARAQMAVSRYLDERKDSNPYLFPRHKEYMLSFGTRNTSPDWYKNPDLVDADQHCDYGTIEHIVRGIGKRAGVPNTHPHRFRRTGATHALNGGMPLLQVSKILGHESIGTTQIYLDISDKDLEAAHEKYVI